MADITERGRLGVTITLQLDESEARALEALNSYGTDAFLEMFYTHLGRHYLSPHEAGLRSLLKTACPRIERVMSRLDRARKEFEKTD